ncbi:hypothetical protein HDU76_006127, partial [Blyttiomyces sp. JEL0837]
MLTSTLWKTLLTYIIATAACASAVHGRTTARTRKSTTHTTHGHTTAAHTTKTRSTHTPSVHAGGGGSGGKTGGTKTPAVAGSGNMQHPTLFQYSTYDTTDPKKTRQYHLKCNSAYVTKNRLDNYLLVSPKSTSSTFSTCKSSQTGVCEKGGDKALCAGQSCPW